MDINQTVRMIEWLDEERRRDKASIARMEERLSLQQEVLDVLQTRLIGIESEHSTLRGGQPGAQREREIIESLRAELLQRLEAGEARRREAEEEAVRRSDLLRQQLDSPVRELESRVTEMERKQDNNPSFQTESDRVTGAMYEFGQRVDDLYRRLEEPERRLSMLEEQRRQDSRTNSATAAELPEIQRQIDAGRNKLALVEDLVLRTEGQLRELAATELERRDSIQSFIDSQGMHSRQLEQLIEAYSARFSEYDVSMEHFTRRFETWAEVFREMKALVDRFERNQERLELRFNELIEVQRIAEERLRQDWERLGDEEQRRRKQFTLANDEVWRSHDREFERFVKAIENLRDRFPPIEDAMERIWMLERERVKRHHEHDLSLLQEYDREQDSELLPARDDEIPGSNGMDRNDA